MTQEIGAVQATLGSVVAVESDGAIRTLHEGDPVFANELILTGTNSAVEIEFMDGDVMDLGYSSQVFLNHQFFDSTLSYDAESQEALLALDVTASFLVDDHGDDILSGTDHNVSDYDLASSLNPGFDDISDMLDLADVLSNPENQIVGVEYHGHLQIQVSNSDGVFQLINLTTVTAADDFAAQSALDYLLSSGIFDDGMS